MWSRWNSLLLVWCLLLSVLTSQAADRLVDIPTLQSPVTDLTQTLSVEEQAALNQKLTQFSQQSGSQVAVLLLPSTQPEEISQFGIRLADAWKIGREKQDDGVIVIIAKNDRKMRIEVGYGLEGAIPDAIAKRIISEQMSPAFKQGQFYQGLDLATDTLIKLIQGERLPAPAQQAHKGHANDWMSLLPILMFAAIIGGAILKGMLGDFPGSLVTGGLLGGLAGLLGATALIMGLIGLAAFVFTMAMGGRGMGSSPYIPGGFGGYSGGSRGPDIFSGGGGGFGGGGASGDW